MQIRRAIPIVVALVAALTSACDKSANPLAPSQEVAPLSAASPQFAAGPSAAPVPAPLGLGSTSSRSSRPQVSRLSHARASLADPTLSRIEGLVNGGSVLPSAVAASTAMTVTATAPGFSSSAMVDAVGRFTVADVPADNIELRFTGVDVDAVLLLTAVGPAQTVRIAVTVEGTTATLESEQRTSLGDQVTLSGTIASRDTSARAIGVSGVTVVVPAGTPIANGPITLTFADLTIGSQVEVGGMALNGRIVADQVEVVGAATGLLATRSGPVSALTGSCPSLTFDVEGTTVVTDGSTVFEDGVCVDLADGVTVEVTGVAGETAVRALAVERTDAEVTLLGPVQNLSGVCPQLAFVVTGVAVTTDFRTSFTDGNCSDVADGVVVEVSGPIALGTLQAAEVEIEGDDTKVPQSQSSSIEGSLVAISGTAPNLTLVVAGTAVRTSTETTVQRKGTTGDLSGLALGQTLHVVGDRATDGSIDARKLQIKEDAVGAVFEIEGSVGGLKGDCPSLTFGIKGFSISTNDGTEFTAPCASLRNSSKAEVHGTVTADGTIVASRVEWEASLGNDSDDDDSGDDDSSDDDSSDDDSSDDDSDDDNGKGGNGKGKGKNKKDDKSKDDTSKDDKSKD